MTEMQVTEKANEVVRFVPSGSRILIRKYEPGEFTAGGIVLPEAAREAQQWGVVTEIGPDCQRVSVHDSVVFPAYTGSDIQIDVDGKMHTFFVIDEADVLGTIAKGG